MSVLFVPSSWLIDAFEHDESSADTASTSSKSMSTRASAMSANIDSYAGAKLTPINKFASTPARHMPRDLAPPLLSCGCHDRYRRRTCVCAHMLRQDPYNVILAHSGRNTQAKRLHCEVRQGGIEHLLFVSMPPRYAQAPQSPSSPTKNHCEASLVPMNNWGSSESYSLGSGKHSNKHPSSHYGRVTRTQESKVMPC